MRPFLKNSRPANYRNKLNCDAESNARGSNLILSASQLPYPSFTKSPLFKLVVGPSSGEYYIHKALLASMSVELDKHVNNEMKEGKTGCMVLSDVAEETIERFLEWAYTNDYSDSCPTQQGSETSEDPTSIPRSAKAISHARLYVFSDRFFIPDLKDIAFARLRQLLQTIGRPSREETPNIVSLLGYACENLLLEDPLVKFLILYAIWCLEDIRGDQSFWGLVEDRIDFTKLLLKEVKVVKIPPPWEDESQNVEKTLDEGLEGLERLLKRKCPDCGGVEFLDIQCPCGIWTQIASERNQRTRLRLLSTFSTDGETLWQSCYSCGNKEKVMLFCFLCDQEYREWEM